MAARKPGAAARPAGGGANSRDRGTRGGRPEASTAAAQQQGSRPARPGNGRPGNGRPGTGQAQAAGQAQRGRTAPVAVAAVEEPGPAGPPSWLQWTTWVLSLAGLGMSLYLTIAHFNTAVSLVCPATSTINCEKVTTSPQSVVFGIPVAVLGLAFYVFLAVANSPWVWRMTWPPLRWARIGSIVVGIVFVLYLIYAELFKIDAICLLCTSVHVITFVLFVLIVFSAAAGYGTAKALSRA
jgi:uncharacterized membrane protein